MVDKTIASKKEPLVVKSLYFKNSFDQLEKQEKLYAYHFYKASWAGYPIVLFNMSQFGPKLFVMLQKFFRSFSSIDESYLKIENGLSAEIAHDFFQYTATIYANSGAYRSYGYTKIYSPIESSIFRSILALSNNDEVLNIFDSISEQIYDESEKTKAIGLSDKGGVNNYYLGDITESEILEVDQFLQKNNILTLNTRLIKFVNHKDNSVAFGYLVGSIDKKVVDHGNNIFGFYGDFSDFLIDLNSNLVKCKEFTQRDNQIKMIDKYLESFKTGSVESHKESQIYWVKDVKPIVETNIGWIETYVDPLGTRGYYEGLVAIVDKENTKKFTNLVSIAGELLSPENITWNSDFEKYPFIEPDYTQIDVVCFASDDCPIGINIPNYDDIRQEHGFKNVTLGNNIGSFKASRIKHIVDEDKLILEKFGLKSVYIHTACHELLGHGSGKLLRKGDDEQYNFNYGKTIDPLTGELVKTFYVGQETYETKFTDIARSYEECRADMNGLYFGKMRQVQRIFDISEEISEDIILSQWYLQVIKAFAGLKFFNPTTNKWGQAHAQGAYVFVSFILNNQRKDNPIIEIEVNKESNFFQYRLRKSAIIEYGHDLIGQILLRLNIWKASANDTAGREFYYSHSSVNDYMLQIREIVIANSVERALTLNHNLKLNENGEIEVIEYEETCKGLIRSFVERFGIETDDMILKQVDMWSNISNLISS